MKMIPIEKISPSPFQHRRHFGAEKLKELGKSIQRDGLLQPITVRKIAPGQYELIAGERRLRAVKEHTQNKEIECRIIEANDMQARRLCAAENLQRDDLSAIEEVGAIAEMVDSELIGDEEYLALAHTAQDRVKRLLGRLKAYEDSKAAGYQPRDEAEKTWHKFMLSVETIFAALPKPVTWRSFYNNDLGILSVPQDILDWAIAGKLNKEQTKQLAKLDREVIEKHFETNDDGVLVPVPTIFDMPDESPKTIGEMSAKEIAGLGRHEKLMQRHEMITKHRASAGREAQSVGFIRGDWRENIDSISDNSIALILTDPPYGMGYVSNFRKEKHKPIEGDGDCAAFRDLCSKISGKMKADSHLLAFVNWRNEAEFMSIIEGAGFTVKSSIVWVKNNTGMGDLTGAFAPKHERILHAVKGRPSLYFREADVICAARVNTDRHPTEKPVDLLEKLIDATTLPGDLVLDPFAGVASTLVAAKNKGRAFIGFEIDETYHSEGLGRILP